jgi:tRNA A-37 threonylcarbamoyl transferase component Bud32
VNLIVNDGPQKQRNKYRSDEIDDANLGNERDRENKILVLCHRVGILEPRLRKQLENFVYIHFDEIIVQPQIWWLELDEATAGQRLGLHADTFCIGGRHEDAI